MNLSDLSNDDLVSSLKTLVNGSNAALAKVIAHLAEVDGRRLYLHRACPSMHVFCTKELRLSEGAAFRRITAARLVREFPSLLAAIASGRIHLSNVVLLSGVLRKDNVDQLVDSVTGKSRREVEVLVARIKPKPDAKAEVRKLPTRSAVVLPPFSSGSPLAGAPSRLQRLPLQPLSEARYKVQFTASTTFRDKLDRARSLMSHSNPGGDLALVVERALDLLIAKLEKDKCGRAERPRNAPPPADPGHITRATRRDVVARDGLRCTFISGDGERCTATHLLEFDHREPRARGGPGDSGNVRILCRAHNRHAAEQAFGRGRIAEQIRLRKLRAGRPTRTPPTGGVPGATNPQPSPPAAVTDDVHALAFSTEPDLPPLPPQEQVADATDPRPPPPAEGPDACPLPPAAEVTDTCPPPPPAEVTDACLLAAGLPRTTQATADPPQAAAPVGPQDPRKCVHAALRSLGFRGTEIHRALSVIEPERWHDPIEGLIRQALTALT